MKIKPLFNLRQLARWRGSFLLFYLVLDSGKLFAKAESACLGLAEGEVFLKISRCQRLDEAKDLELNAEKKTVIRNMSAGVKQKFVKSYDGLWLFGNVERSMVIRKGISAQKGYLSGTKISAFSSEKKESCEQIKGKIVRFQLKEACCQGGVDVPCILGTSYTLGPALGFGKESLVKKSNRKPDSKKTRIALREAKRFFDKKAYGSAIAVLKKLGPDEVNARSNYLLSLSYYSMDLFDPAINLLEPMRAKFDGSKDYWQDEEAVYRRAIFLLARCYARSADAGRAVLVLRGFFPEAKKYSKELKMSLTHPDFGWIHTYKDYKDYKAEAEKLIK